MEYYNCYNDELYHHGVKGMKWGVRKKRPLAGDVASKKAAYKQAKRAYSKSFDNAYNKSIAAWSPFKKHRQANDARWEDAANKAEALNKAKKAYKMAKANAKTKAKAERALAKMEKQQYKDAVKQRSKEILKGESFVGKMWDITTGGHKIQAEIEVGLEKRGYE